MKTPTKVRLNPRNSAWVNSHPDAIMDAARRAMFGTESVGLCIGCGMEHSGVEPDSRGEIRCESCHGPVFGAEELIAYIA
jgi:hypothetical protein